MGHPAAEYRLPPPRGCSGRLGAARRWPELRGVATATSAQR